jgi:hypothetical protein
MKVIVIAKTNTECTVIIPKYKQVQHLHGTIAGMCCKIADYLTDGDEQIIDVLVDTDGYGYWFIQRLMNHHGIIAEELESVNCMNSK